MLKRFSAPLIAAVLLVSLFLWLWSSPFWKSLRWIGSIMELVHAEYVDEEDVSYEALAEAAARGILSSLDPFSGYLDEDEFGEFQISSGQEYSGIGVEIVLLGDYVTLSHVDAAGPGGRAGLMVGDQIIRVEEDEMKGASIQDVSSQVRGPEGSTVELTIRRLKESQDLQIEVIRGTVQMKTLRDIRMVSSGVGYIRISQFADDTASSFRSAVTSLEAQVQGNQLDGLVVDLRGNPGGYLRAAVELTGYFFEEGTKILSRVGRDDEASEEYFAPQTSDFYHFPLVFLVDDLTASAGEIFAGVLQDLDRAEVVGKSTYGKGSIQQVYKLREGGGVRLTMAKYVFPSGVSIAKKGVEPDYPLEDEIQGYLQLFLSRRFEDVPSEKFEEWYGMERLEKDPWLEKALAILEEASP